MYSFYLVSIVSEAIVLFDFFYLDLVAVEFMVVEAYEHFEYFGLYDTSMLSNFSLALLGPGGFSSASDVSRLCDISLLK